jgi:hypothetical protein
MRSEETDFDWRMVIGEEARALVLDVLKEGQKPGAKDLENAIQRMKVDLASAKGQAEGSRAVVAEVTSRLESTIHDLKQEHALVMMVVGKAHRELFLIRQLLGLLKFDDDAEIKELMERLRDRDTQWKEFMQSVMPGFEQSLPGFDAEMEKRAVRQLTIHAIDNDTRVKPADKAKQAEKGDKGEERER